MIAFCRFSSDRIVGMARNQLIGSDQLQCLQHVVVASSACDNLTAGGKGASVIKVKKSAAWNSRNTVDVVNPA